MERIEAFEKMLLDVQSQYEFEKKKMEELKAAGKERSATYRQFMGNRLMYHRIFELYRQYGLLENEK